MYSKLKAALSASGIPFAEYAWNNAPHTGSYGVISLDTEADAVWSDNRQQEQAVQGTVDLFCHGTNLDDMRLVQRVLNDSGVSWGLNSVQHEREKHLVHYEWVFELEAL